MAEPATPLRVLIVDDSADDAELVLDVLRNGGFDPAFRRVDTAEAMDEALDAQLWDLVISDWHMPQFSAPAAFQIMSGKNLDLPFIIVSGTIEEKSAVEALRAGAHDFMSKDRPVRLPTAVQRELREAAVRRDRRQMQEQLFLADRMASVGLLAAGIAHEIGNPLTSVASDLELALDDLDRVDESDAVRNGVLERLTNASAGASRIRQLVQDLKVFARGDSTRSPIDLRHALDFALRVASHELQLRARVVKDYGDVPKVSANQGLLEQLFLNLIVNAAHAIDQGTPETNEICVVTATTAQGHAAVEVRDTGCGMSRELINRLFTPFFATKPVGTGTGLGLSICNRIVTELGGTIAVESVVGKGTTFRIALPPVVETSA
jgi:signal transduction histidine kinase